MNLEALLEPIPDRNKKQPCKVGRILEQLEEPYLTAVLGLLAHTYENGGLASEALADRFNKAGFEVGATVVHRHRKGMCTCA
jgi:hypothetical protein